MPKLTVKCQWCSNEFQTFPSQQRKFCSPHCYGLSHSAAAIASGRGTSNKPRRGSFKQCEACGIDFYVEPRRAPTSRYCSRECQAAGQTKVRTIACHRCGKAIKSRPSEQRRYCSRECVVQDRRSDAPMPPCEVCGMPVKKHTNLFCSRQCFDISQRNGETLPCAHCGKSLYKIKSDANRKYCSRTCANAGHSIDGPGAKVARHDGYIAVYYPKHPDATRGGLILEHRLVAEQKYGRRLLRSEHVHHINGIRDDNRPENLEVIAAGAHAKVSNKQGVAKRKAIRDELAAYRRLYGPLQKE